MDSALSAEGSTSSPALQMPPKRSRKKIIFTFLILSSLLIISFAIILTIISNRNVNYNQSDTNTPTTIAENDESSTCDTKYRNEDFGFELCFTKKWSGLSDNKSIDSTSAYSDGTVCFINLEADAPFCLLQIVATPINKWPRQYADGTKAELYLEAARNNKYVFMFEYNKNDTCFELGDQSCEMVQELPSILTTFQTFDIENEFIATSNQDKTKDIDIRLGNGLTATSIDIKMTVPSKFTLTVESLKYPIDGVPEGIERPELPDNAYLSYTMSYGDYTLKFSSPHEVFPAELEIVKDLGNITGVGELLLVRNANNSDTTLYYIISKSMTTQARSLMCESNFPDYPCGEPIITLDKGFFIANCEANTDEGVNKCVETFKGITSLSVGSF